MFPVLYTDQSQKQLLGRNAETYSVDFKALQWVTDESLRAAYTAFNIKQRQM